MAFEKRLNLVNNISGLLGIGYAILLFGIGFFFKDKSDLVLKVAVPIFIVVSIIVVFAVIFWRDLKEKFKDIKGITQDIKKLKELNSLDKRFRKIEEKLISHEYALGNMGGKNQISMNRKGLNYTPYFILLGILFAALLVWFFYILRTG